MLRSQTAERSSPSFTMGLDRRACKSKEEIANKMEKLSDTGDGDERT